MHKITTIFLAVFTIAWLVSCDRPTSGFERDNTHDPLNENYNTGSASEIEISYNSEGIITIGWQDTAQFEDGFIIEKSLVDSSSFEEVGRVDANVTIFRDSTRMVRKDTYYRVVAFKNRENDTDRRASTIKKIANLGEITGFQNTFISDSNALNLSWESNSPFDKIYRLYYKKARDSEYALLRDFSPDITAYTDELADISFEDRMYKLELYLVGDTFEDKISESTTVLESMLFEPTDLTVQIQDEQTVVLSWQDNSFFEEGFKIFLNGEEIHDQPANKTEFIYDIDFRAPKGYSFSIIAYNSTSESTEKDSFLFYNIPTPYFTYTSQGNTSSTSHTISWDIDNDQYVVEYILQRLSKISGTWEEIGRYGKNTKEATVSDLDPNEEYTYRIRTLSSEDDMLNLYYVDTYEKNGSVQAHDLAVTNIEIDEINNRLATHSYFKSNYGYQYGEGDLKVWDITTLDLVTEIDNKDYMIASSFNNDGSFLASIALRTNYIEGNKSFDLFQMPGGSTQLTLSDTSIEDFVFASNDSTIYAVTRIEGNLKKINIYEGTEELLYTGQGYQYSSYDWHTLVGSKDHRYLAMDGEQIRIFDGQTGNLLHQISTEYDYLRYPSLELSDNGGTLTYILRNKIYSYSSPDWSIISIFDLALMNYGNDILTDFKPGSDSILATAYSRGAFVYNIVTEKLLGLLYTDTQIRSLRYLPDGSGFLIGRYDGILEKWEVSGQKIWRKIN